MPDALGLGLLPLSLPWSLTGVVGWSWATSALLLWGGCQASNGIPRSMAQVLPVRAHAQGINIITPKRLSQPCFLWSVSRQAFSYKLYPHVASGKLKGRIIHLNKKQEPRRFTKREDIFCWDRKWDDELISRRDFMWLWIHCVYMALYHKCELINKMC